MPSVCLADGELNYSLEGPTSGPTLMLSNSLGTDLGMWDSNTPIFTKHFRVLRYDTRGHGASTVSPGPYCIEQLGRDALALLDALHIRRTHFCGLSMGGLIGQWMAVNAPERIERLVLCNTAARIGTSDTWNSRINTVLAGGVQAMEDLREASIQRWFTPTYVERAPETVEVVVSMLARTDPLGYAANCAAVRDADFRAELSRINATTLIVCGASDQVTTTEDGRFMQSHIVGAELAEFPAAHLSNVEMDDSFSLRVMDFLLK